MESKSPDGPGQQLDGRSGLVLDMRSGSPQRRWIRLIKRTCFDEQVVSLFVRMKSGSDI